MWTAIRNILDLLIRPYSTFMRVLDKNTFDIFQYVLYILSILNIEKGRSIGHIALDIVCISVMSFIVAAIYFQVIRICGGELSYWRCFNIQVCMATLTSLGSFFELMNRVGGAISFAISIYCLYLHIRAAIIMGQTMMKRVIIVYIAIFVSIIGILYLGVGTMAGALISHEGYI